MPSGIHRVDWSCVEAKRISSLASSSRSFRLAMCQVHRHVFTPTAAHGRMMATHGSQVASSSQLKLATVGRRLARDATRVAEGHGVVLKKTFKKLVVSWQFTQVLATRTPHPLLYHARL